MAGNPGDDSPAASAAAVLRARPFLFRPQSRTSFSPMRGAGMGEVGAKIASTCFERRLEILGNLSPPRQRAE